MCVKRQFIMLEFQYVFVIKLGKFEFDDGDLLCIGDMVFVCVGLVMVDENNGIIWLVYYIM